MIVTHITARGPQGYVFLTRAEGPVRIIIEKSLFPQGTHHYQPVLHGTLYGTSSLDDLYRLLSPLLYGVMYPENAEAAELEALIRPLLRMEALPGADGSRIGIG